MMRRKASLLLAAFGMTASLHAATLVGVELQLLVDVSASISAAEFQLQRSGYAAAFNEPSIIAAIEANEGGIAVQMVHWSGVDQQKIVIDWTHLTDAASSKAFSAKIAAAPRSFVAGLTAVQAVLLFGSTQFDNDFQGKKLITDISGDGFCNDPGKGLCGTAGKDAMTALKVRVNGLVIDGDPAVESYYKTDVLTNGGKLFTAASSDDFGAAIIQKILAEADPHNETALPEPSAQLMILVGLATLAIGARRSGVQA